MNTIYVREKSTFIPIIRWKKFCSVVFILLAVPLLVAASHFRFGLLTATKISETATTITYRLNASTSWRTDATGGSSNRFFISGGNSGFVDIPMTYTLDPSGLWANGTGSAIVTLNKTSIPTILSFSSCCKISTLANNRDQNWDVYIILNTASSGNSPVSSLPAIINMPVNSATATYTIPVSDPDPGSTFTFGTPFSTRPALSGQSNPSGFSLDPATGQITFNTIGKTIGQLYNALATVTDNDGNQIMLDFIIRIVGPSNPPQFDYTVTPANGEIYNVIAGQNISFPIKATDSDLGSTVGLSVSGLPAYITTSNFSPALPATGNPSQTSFSWTPNATHIGNTVVLNFIATDNVGVQSTTSVTLKVVAEPAPDFVSPTPSEGTIRQIIPGVLHQDVITAQSSLGSNVSIAFATTPAGSTLSPTIPTPAAHPATTTLSWSPTAANWGAHNLSYQAVIAAVPTIFSTRSYTLVVNTPPAFTSTPITTVDAGQLYTYNITVNDPDVPYGDQLDIITSSLPSWLNLTDNGDGTATLSGTPTAADAGPHTIHLHAEDFYHHGNPSHVEQEFSIEVVACNTNVITKNITVFLDATGNVSIAGSDVDNGSTADCGIQSLTVSPNTFTCANVGVNSVTLSLINNMGITSSATAVVTVKDNLPPVILTNGDHSVTNDAGKCGATVAVSAAATDNCAVGDPEGSRDDDEPLTADYPVGTTTITWNVTDVNGNPTTVTQTVTVTNADPILTSVSGPTDPVAINVPINLVVAYTDNNVSNATINWGDGSTAQTVSNPAVSFTTPHIYTAAGVYTVNVSLTDACGRTASYAHKYVVIYDPSAGFVTGAGWITSPAGAYIPDLTLAGKATFGFVSKYQKGAKVPTGNTEFQFHAAGMNFKSTSYEWLVISGSKAQYKGVGTINGGSDEYGFILTVIDGALVSSTTPDKLRIKIWNASGTVYDNQMGAALDADATTAIDNGSIIIHVPKGKTSTIVSDQNVQTVDVYTGKLNVQVRPNPSTVAFELVLRSSNNQPAVLRVVDAAGRVLESRNNISANSTQRVGDTYRPGVYFAEVMQGTERVMVKLIKQPN
ncbi:T9SS type A sorting domain-containing protein [Flavisolibacter sp. BT320]|nr:T9SS type A sorting domain-containing protein [Flavisolibacter longurius]